jgi:hypothetical protein
MDTKVVIMMMVLAALQIIRELLGIYRDEKDSEFSDGS